MASPSGRLPSAPSQGTPATRTALRPLLRANQARVSASGPLDAGDDSGRVAQAVATATNHGVRFTRRMAALVAVLVILLFSYGSSLRVYFSLQAQSAATNAAIQASKQTIEQLHNELARWEDPAYIKAQARDRLGWVMPGEIGFQVIGPDGKPLGGHAPVGSDLPAGEQPQTWWDRLLGSVAAADDPAPAK